MILWAKIRHFLSVIRGKRLTFVLDNQGDGNVIKRTVRILSDEGAGVAT